MAINVNTVYTSVLSILNKEQRGYLTPYEFNQLATQVQLEIFESYFENLNQQLRAPENNSEYADRVKMLQEKISTFETSASVNVVVANNVGTYDFSAQNPAVHRFGRVDYTNGSKLPVEIDKVTRQEFLTFRRSPLTAPSQDYPICYIEGTTIKILPAIATAASVNGSPAKSYTLEYVKKPVDPVWNYTVGSVGQYIFDPVANGVSKDFEISDLDQTEVILKILMYAGVVIRDPEIVQQAAQAVAAQDQLEQI
jgi:hypothetical protein